MPAMTTETHTDRPPFAFPAHSVDGTGWTHAKKKKPELTFRLLHWGMFYTMPEVASREVTRPTWQLAFLLAGSPDPALCIYS